MNCDLAQRRFDCNELVEKAEDKDADQQHEYLFDDAVFSGHQCHYYEDVKRSEHRCIEERDIKEKLSAITVPRYSARSVAAAAASAASQYGTTSDFRPSEVFTISANDCPVAIPSLPEQVLQDHRHN